MSMLLLELLKQAEREKKAIGHFNISDLVGFKAIFEAAREIGVPVVIGTSEGEREFIGPKSAVGLVRNLREEYGYPIFINADHTHSFEKVQEAVLAGYDSIIADFANLPLEDNIRETKRAVEYAKSVRPEIIVEGELGYIGTSSEVLTEMPKGAAVAPEDMTKPEDAARFVAETGVDLLAPAVGNIHGMFQNAPSPRLDVQRIMDIKASVPSVPLVLHGGSGILDEDFKAAIQAGISMVHINTEIRKAWREGLAVGLQIQSVAPYKIVQPALEGVKKVVLERLRLFSA